ncbi:MAG: hypothetical protein ACRC1K_14640, partial [Planctomycetia bacterium]
MTVLTAMADATDAAPRPTNGPEQMLESEGRWKATEDHRPTLLIVDDNETLRERLAKAFTSRGYIVRI